MREIADAEHGARIRQGRFIELSARHRCAVEGRGAPAPFRLYCDDCAAQIASLAEWREKREARERLALFRSQERRERIRTAASAVARWLRRWLWVINLAFVAGALLYLGAVYGAALLQWMGER